MMLTLEEMDEQEKKKKAKNTIGFSSGNDIYRSYFGLGMYDDSDDYYLGSDGTPRDHFGFPLSGRDIK